MSKSIDPKDVEIFLLDNPDFFVSREAILSELDFKHNSGNASSLLERQIKRLREEQNTLIDLLTSFVDEAKVNEDLFIKSKNLTLSILEASNDEEITQQIEKEYLGGLTEHNSFFPCPEKQKERNTHITITITCTGVPQAQRASLRTCSGEEMTYRHAKAPRGRAPPHCSL